MFSDANRSLTESCTKVTVIVKCIDQSGKLINPS